MKDDLLGTRWYLSGLNRADLNGQMTTVLSKHNERYHVRINSTGQVISVLPERLRSYEDGQVTLSMLTSAIDQLRNEGKLPSTGVSKPNQCVT
jgi:hypothetical protein